MELTPTEGFNIVEKIARNNHQWGGERNHLKKEENDSSSQLKSDLESLTKTVKALTQSVSNMSITQKKERSTIYEVNNVSEDACERGGQDDVNYVARGYDGPYIPPPIQRQEKQVRLYQDSKPTSNSQYWNHQNNSQGQQRFQQGGNQSKERYLGPNTNQNYNSKYEDKKQEELSMAQLMTQMINTQTQMMTMQAQQEKNMEYLMSAQKMLETQLAQRATSSSRNHRILPSQPDVMAADVNAITLKNGKVLEEPTRKENSPNYEIKNNVQPEGENVVEEKEMQIVALSAYVTPIPSPQRYLKAKYKASFNWFAQIL